MLKKTFKKATATLVIFGMLVGNAAYAASPITPESLNQQKPSSLLGKENVKASDLKDIDPNQEVRVVVELDGDAAIEIATKKGVRYEKLTKAEQKKLKNEAKAKQKTIKDNLRKQKVNAEYLQEFTTVMNGFSAKVKFSEIEKIEAIKGVEEVYIANEYELPKEEASPDMYTSKELIEAQDVWRDFGLDGEGMVIGIIDSGIDYTHKDLVLSNPENAKINEHFIDHMKQEHALPGNYFTDKVPYGYNYMDNDLNIVDGNLDTDAHGMHVAGTAAANGDEENGGIKGVAPEAQLLALRVFGEHQATTYDDIYVAAIDDAIELGADVLNMSLGSGAGFVDSESAAQQAVARAMDNGIIVTISAGNSDKYGSGFFYPYTSNPDYGVVGSPSVSYDSLSVASLENTNMTVDAANVSIDGGEDEKVMYLSAGQTPPPVDENFELVHAGLGHPADFEGKDLEGKYALVQRGELDFVTKALNAQAAGAAGIIVYNNTDGTVNMASDAAIIIPQLFMLKSDGDRFAAALAEGQTVSVSFSGETMSVPNSAAGTMSTFTSWGITPNLDFKPEITTPGGQIYSTVNNDSYGIKSGTSMAAPHAAGGSALVLEHVDNVFNLDGQDRALRAKNLMLNTAAPVLYAEGGTVSPRQQGAGLMQLHAALTTPVMVTNAETGEAKVALKEVTANEVTFELVAENFSDEAVTYEASANAQTDAPVNAGGGIYVSYPELAGSLELDETTSVNGSEVATVEIPANGSATIEVKIDVSDWDASLKSYFSNGYWLEGFVTLTDPSDVNPEINVPYVGFKGDWDAAPIFDAPIWEVPNSFYEESGVLTHVGGGSFNYLGVDQATGAINPDIIAISPNGDGQKEDANMLLGVLRNAKNIKFNVLDADGNVVRTITEYDYVRKTYYDQGRAATYFLTQDTIWDGKINGEVAPEGQYYLQADGVIDFEGADRNTIEMPVKLDLTAPEISAELGEDGQTITVDLSDNLSGVGLWAVFVDGTLAAQYDYTTTEHVLAAPLAEGQEVVVVAVDNAGNQGEAAVEGEEEDTEAPVITITSPSNGGVVHDKKVTLQGYVTDASAIASLMVNGEAAEVTYNAATGHYEFSVDITPDRNGPAAYFVSAVDEHGNSSLSYGYYVYTGRGPVVPVRPIPGFLR